jgi:phage-related protein
VKPAEGRLVRHPDTYEQIKPEGLPVELNSYWIRKEKACDVVIEKAAVPAETKGEKQ